MQDVHVRNESGQPVSPATEAKLIEVLSKLNEILGELEVPNLPEGAATASNQTDGSQKTKIVETSPVADNKFNSATLISFNAAGDTVYVDEIKGGITYRVTFTRSDMTVATTLSISSAVQQP
jgi:hypothetical protein